MQITTLDALVKAAQDGKAVITHKGCFSKRHCAAAFVVSMQARIVHNLIQSGLFIYEPKPKAEKQLS